MIFQEAENCIMHEFVRLFWWAYLREGLSTGDYMQVKNASEMTVFTWKNEENVSYSLIKENLYLKSYLSGTKL